MTQESPKAGSSDSLNILNLALIFALLDTLTLVVLVLTLAETNLQFGQSLLIDKQSQRNNRLTRILHLTLQLAQLLALEQELAIATHLVVGVTAKTVLGNMHLLHPQLIPLEQAIGVHQRGLRLADGLDFGAKQLDACDVAIEDRIIEGCTPIFDIYIAFCKHISEFWCKITKKFGYMQIILYLCSDFRIKCTNNMLKTILAITGKPGLYKLVSRGNNMLIVESLVDGKRMPTYARDKIVALSDISMFTNGDDVALSEVLTKLGEKEGLKPASLDAKKADNEQLREYFATFLPDFDRDRVYPSDIRKLVVWYNTLIAAGITDFSVKEEEDTEEPVAEAPKAEPVKEVRPKKQAVKTQKSAASSARTGVGTKRG